MQIPEVKRVGTGGRMEQFQAVGDGADGAAAFAGDVGDGQVLHAVKTEDGDGGRVFSAAGSVEAIENLEDAAGDFVGLLS